MDINNLKQSFDEITNKYKELEIKINEIDTKNTNKRRIFTAFLKKINLELIHFYNKINEFNLEIDELGSNINLINLESKIINEIKEHNLNKKVFKKFLIPMLIYKNTLLDNN